MFPRCLQSRALRLGSLALEREEETAAESMRGRGLAEPLQPAAPGPTSLERLVAPLGIQSQQFSRRAEDFNFTEESGIVCCLQEEKLGHCKPRKGKQFFTPISPMNVLPLQKVQHFGGPSEIWSPPLGRPRSNHSRLVLWL